MQGVWFRGWFLKEANKLNLKGYVKNLKDKNTVEALIQGNITDINKMIKLAYVGPQISKVDNIFKEKISNNIKFIKFVIK